jgi:hypothetical protein
LDDAYVSHHHHPEGFEVCSETHSREKTKEQLLMAPKAAKRGGGGGGDKDADKGDNLTVEQQAALAEQERLTLKAYENKVRFCFFEERRSVGRRPRGTPVRSTFALFPPPAETNQTQHNKRRSSPRPRRSTT